VAVAIRDSDISFDVTAVAAFDVDTSGHTWQNGDYTISVLTIGGTSVTLDSVAGQDVTGGDTYAEMANALQSGAKVYAHEGTITSPFDAVTRFNFGGGTRRPCGGVISFSGAESNANQPDVASGSATGADSAPVNPSIDTVTNGAMVLSIVGIQGAHDLTAIVPPAGYAMLGSWRTNTVTAATNSNHATLAIAYQTQATAGATGAAAWSGFGGTVQPWSAITVAVRAGAARKFILSTPAA
jgi:hypothetical protein